MIWNGYSIVHQHLPSATSGWLHWKQHRNAKNYYLTSFSNHITSFQRKSRQLHIEVCNCRFPWRVRSAHSPWFLLDSIIKTFCLALLVAYCAEITSSKAPCRQVHRVSSICQTLILHWKQEMRRADLRNLYIQRMHTHRKHVLKKLGPALPLRSSSPIVGHTQVPFCVQQAFLMLFSLSSKGKVQLQSEWWKISV